MLIRIGRGREVFHENVIFFTWGVPYVTIQRLYKSIYIIAM